MNVPRNDSISISSETHWIERKYFHTKVEWKIACVGYRVAKPGDKIISPIFECSDTSWQITVYPRGECKNSDASIYVSIVGCSSYNKYTAYFNFAIFDHNGKVLRRDSSGKCNFDSSSIVKKVSLGTAISDLFPNQNEWTNSFQKQWTISFRISVEETSIPVAPLKAPVTKDLIKHTERLCRSLMSLSSDFEKLYQETNAADVTLMLGDHEIGAHKMVLCARSKVFAAMFEHDMEENKHSTVDVDEMEYHTLVDMLRYMYCGHVRELSPEEALNLYVAADRYALEELKACCRDLILTAVSLRNVCDVAAIADLHNDELLINSIKYFVSVNGKDMIKTEKWKALSTEKPVLCVKMFEWTLSE